MSTFNDFYDYILLAKRDHIGMHTPANIESNVKLHIYENKRQCNIVVDDMPIAVFLFHPEDGEVTLVQVNNGVANYDNPTKVDLDTITDEADFTNYFGPAGPTVHKILDDILNQDKLEAKEREDEPRQRPRVAQPGEPILDINGRPIPQW